MHDNTDTLPCFVTFVNFRFIDVFCSLLLQLWYF